MITLQEVETLGAGQIQMELFEIANDCDRAEREVATATKDRDLKQASLTRQTEQAKQRNMKLSSSFADDLAKAEKKLAEKTAKLNSLLELSGACHARLEVLANQ